MVPTFVQVLRQLRCLATACLANNNYDSVVSNHCKQVIPDAEDWEEFSLLFQSLTPCEFTHRGLLLRDRVSIPILFLVIYVLCRGWLLCWSFFGGG